MPKLLALVEGRIIIGLQKDATRSPPVLQEFTHGSSQKSYTNWLFFVVNMLELLTVSILSIMSLTQRLPSSGT